MYLLFINLYTKTMFLGHNEQHLLLRIMGELKCQRSHWNLQPKLWLYQLRKYPFNSKSHYKFYVVDNLAITPSDKFLKVEREK